MEFSIQLVVLPLVVHIQSRHSRISRRDTLNSSKRTSHIHTSTQILVQCKCSNAVKTLRVYGRNARVRRVNGAAVAGRSRQNDNIYLGESDTSDMQIRESVEIVTNLFVFECVNAVLFCSDCRQREMRKRSAHDLWYTRRRASIRINTIAFPFVPNFGVCVFAEIRWAGTPKSTTEKNNTEKWNCIGNRRWTREKERKWNLYVIFQRFEWTGILNRSSDGNK